MKKNKIFTVPFRRKREGRTYYRKRIKLLLSNKFRFVIRKSSKNFKLSIIEYAPKGDKILFTIDSNKLSKLGWKGDNGNLPSAYLTGVLAGKKALEIGVNEAILDIGFNNSTKGSRLYAALAGAIDAGLIIPVNQGTLPSKDRISGSHIAKYAHSLISNKPKYEKQFSNYLKRGLAPENIVQHFNEVIAKINDKTENREKA